MGRQKRWPQRVRPTGKPFKGKSCFHCKWKAFIILSLQMGISYQTFSFFSPSHLSYPSHCIYHSLSLPASDSTCICWDTKLFLQSLCIIIISVFSVAFLFITTSILWWLDTEYLWVNAPVLSDLKRCRLSWNDYFHIWFISIILLINQSML